MVWSMNQYCLWIDVPQISHLYSVEWVSRDIQPALLPYLTPAQVTGPSSLSIIAIVAILSCKLKKTSWKDEMKRWGYISCFHCKAGSAKISLMLCARAHLLPHLRVGVQMHPYACDQPTNPWAYSP